MEETAKPAEGKLCPDRFIAVLIADQIV